MNLVEWGSLPEHGRSLSDIIVLYNSRNADNLKISVRESSTNAINWAVTIELNGIAVDPSDEDRLSTARAEPRSHS